MEDNSYRLRYEARKLVRRLSSQSARRRAAALSRLREFGPDGLFELHEAIDQEKTQWQYRQGSLSCMLLVLVLPTMLISWGLFQADWNQKPLIASVALILGTLITAGVLSHRKPASGYHWQVIALAEVGDLSSLVRLIEALDVGEPRARDHASNAVATLLPSIDSENIWLIGMQSRETLYRHLRGNHVPLIVGILKTLQIMQDDAALPMLEKLEWSERPTAINPEVRTALLAVLPLIRVIAAHKSGKQTLLRASDVSHAVADTALRPASGAAESIVGELLRPSNVET